MIGIYKIENIINNKVYIGQSWDIESRWKNEIKAPPNDHIKSSFQKYGIDNFKFTIIHELLLVENKIEIQNQLNELEKFYILQYKSYDKEFGYNKRMGGGFGGKPTQETKDKIKNNKERSNNISKSRRGKTYEDYYGDDSNKYKKLLTRNCHTKEALKKSSLKKKGTKNKITTCPFCGKTGGVQQLIQWHFDNCIKNPNRKTEKCPHCGKKCSQIDKRLHFDNCLKNSNKSKYLVKCPYCDKEGYVSLMKRYHFDKCKNKEQ